MYLSYIPKIYIPPVIKISEHVPVIKPRSEPPNMVKLPWCCVQTLSVRISINAASL